MQTKEDECHLRIQELLKITKDTPLHDSIVYIFDRPYSLNIYEREIGSTSNEQQTKGSFYDYFCFMTFQVMH